jgi:hypothetical protein
MSELINPFVPIEDYNPNDPEGREYLVILKFKPEYAEDDEFEGMKAKYVLGRSAAYMLIYENLQYIIITKSDVLVQAATLEERITVYQFMKHFHNLSTDESFDIDNYLDEDYDDIPDEDEDSEEEYQEPTDEEYLEKKSNFSSQVKQNSKVQQEMLLLH